MRRPASTEIETRGSRRMFCSFRWSNRVPISELVAVATEPREGHVRRAVGVEGDDVRERVRVDDRTHLLGQLHRQDATSATTATISSP